MTDPVARPSFWLRLPLVLLPAHVREEHEREIRQLLALEREAGRSGPRRWLSVARDAVRAAPGAHWDVLRQDLILALRQARRAPGVAVAAILVLAVGIGGNTALFSVVDGVLFRPLPYRDHDRLVRITEEQAERGLRNFGIAPANFRDLTRDAPVFAAAAVFDQTSGTVTVGETPDRVTLARVDGSFFRVFADAPIMGRVLGPADDVAGGTAAVVSHAFWAGVLGSDPDVVGRAFELDGVQHQIVGVMPARFEYPIDGIALWKPIGLGPDEWARRGARWLGAVALLRPGAEVAEARDVVGRRAAALAQAHRDTNDGWSATADGLQAAIVGDARRPLLLVWAAGGLVLLVAVANVASLLLGRAVARERELALRGALGARAGRLTRQLLTEGFLLAVIGGGLGLGLAWWLLHRLTAVGGTALPRVEDVALGGRAAAFAALAALAVTLLFSALPALLARRVELWHALHDGRTGPGRDRARWQGILVTGEVALAVLVLVGTALVVRTLGGLLDRPLGFEPRGALTFRIEPPWRIDQTGPMDSLLARLAVDRGRAVQAYTALERRLAELPGVTAVGAVNRLPLTGNYWVTSIDLAARPASSPEERPSPHVRVVTPGYFEAMGSRILLGRGILPTDAAGAEQAIVIDETFRRQLLGDDDPLGAEILLDGPPGVIVRGRVVGVVEPVYMSGLDTDQRPAFYVSLAQALEGHFLNWGMDVVARGARRDAEPAIRAAVRDGFIDAPVFRVATLDELIAASVADRRFQLLVLGLFAATALVLAVVGVAGVLTLVVRQRMRELGVRLALGARTGAIWWLVQRRGLRLAGIGALIGIAGALLLSRGFASLVYGVSVRDPISLLAAPALLLVVVFAAAAIPAARATRIDPVRTLKEE